MGDKGDVFHVFGGEFKIIATRRVKLGTVAEFYWKEEGADSADGFKKIWESIHPRRGYDPEQMVYLHWFLLTAREE